MMDRSIWAEAEQLDAATLARPMATSMNLVLKVEEGQHEADEENLVRIC